MWKNKSEKPYEVTLIADRKVLPENIEEITVELSSGKTNIKAKAAQKTSEGEGYETNEHIIIGNEGFQCFLKRLEELDPGGDFTNYIPLIETPENKNTVAVSRLELKKNLILPSGQLVDFTLTPGEIVALAGDYFGKPEEPISFATGANDKDRLRNRKDRFRDSYQTLIEPENYEQIQKILKYTQEQAILSTENNQVESPPALHKKPDGIIKNTFTYSWITRTSNTPRGVCHSRYAVLGANNFDHFGNEAALAFEAGLSLAVDCAETARTKKDEKKKADLLKEAIFFVLFACHFLTDLYAAGHVNTPRKELLNALTNQPLDAIPDLKTISSTKLMLAGLLAKRMHDENSNNSIWVKSLLSKETWQMYGDGNYAHPDNYSNAEKVKEAVALALKDVFLSYMGNPKKEPLFLETFRQIIPIFSEELNAKCNYTPLFKVVPNKSHIEMRQSNGKYAPLTLTSALKESCHIKVQTTDTSSQTLSPEQIEAVANQYEETPEGLRCTLI